MAAPAPVQAAEPDAPLIDRERLLAAGGLGLASLVLYTLTLAPDILAHDVAEWQGAAASLGISHSPGAPTYTILGWLFSLVPLGSVPARVSFLSALTGAAGVAATFLFVIMLFSRWLPALVSAVVLALAGLWWSHATVATPYNAIPVLIAVFLILLLLWQKSGDARLVYAGALLFGLGLGYHPTLVLYLPVLLAGLVLLGPWRSLLNARPLILTALFMLAGLSVYVYLPLRSAAQPAIQYTQIDSLSAFADFVTGGEQREAGQHGFARFPGWSHLKDRIYETVRQSFHPAFSLMVFVPAVFLAYPTVWAQVLQRGRFLGFLLGGALVHMTLVVLITGYFAQYYLPLLLYFAILAGFSVWLIELAAATYLPAGWIRRLPVIITVGFYAVVLAMGLPRAWAFADHSQDTAMRGYVDEVFAAAPEGSLVLAEWESYAGLLYAQKVEGQRPDLLIAPVRDDEAERWNRYLAAYEAQRPGAPVLLSLTLTGGGPETGAGMEPLTGEIYLSGKGRTFQDRDHGEPYPLTVMLFRLTPGP